MQQDHRGDSGRRVGAPQSQTGRRRAMARGALGTVALIGLGAATAGWMASGAQAADLRASPAAGHPFLAPLAWTLGTEVTPRPTADPAAPGTEVTGGADQSDPFLTVAAGRYLLLTSGGAGAAPVNVPLATSTDFIHWTEPVDALPTLPVWAHPGYTWAPELHRFGNLYALYFTAMVAGYTPQTECIGSAFATSPTGPFTAGPIPLICQLDQGGSIDPRVFIDSDGTPWMQWKSDQNIGGSDTPTKMWSQRLSADGTSLLGSPTLLMSPDEAWQGSIVEAPDMVELHGTYWVVYSANWYNQPEYAIGAARCTGPGGPCHDQTPSPLLATNLQGEGPGEASVFHDGNGVWLLYSPWRSLAPKPDIPARPVYIARLGFGSSGPYLAGGSLPGPTNLLARPLWAATP
ncbi:MAG TPA: glycoside hydrolase family 43 protein [Acidimicrobiales bacterium]